MKYKIDVVTRLQDNGDGGYTMYVYNSQEEMLENHPKSRKWDQEKKAYVNVLTQEQRDEILSEDDPYNNGYIDTDSIEIEIENGKAKLSNPLAFSAGQ